jgi:hypothetical protein
MNSVYDEVSFVEFLCNVWSAFKRASQRYLWVAFCLLTVLFYDFRVNDNDVNCRRRLRFDYDSSLSAFFTV